MLLFFDIDGTLFDGRRQMPASVLPALTQAKQNGHSLFVNTGRTLCNMDHRLDSFPFDGWIMGCGTRIILHGTTVQSMEYDPEHSLKLRNLFRSLHFPVVYECDTGMYFDPEGTFHPAIPHFRRFAEDHGLYRVVSDSDPEFRLVKMFSFTEDPALIQNWQLEAKKLGMPYTAINRGDGGWEMIPAGYSKASGIDIVCRKLGVSTKECFAFGDSPNDLSMLLHVKYSIAMGNAPDEVKVQCFYVTDLPENGGIAKAMKHFGLI